jgi:long-chain acyl-CoA synthetase
MKIGTVGPPLPGVEVRIADDGEILIKGPILFQGYWRNEQATRETLTADGWLRTGDLGALDDDGFLSISGRKKEIIVTAGGKNLAPAPLEDCLRAHPLISQAVVVGDQRPYAAALITLDAEALEPWKRDAGRPEQAGPAELRDDPDLLAQLQTAVDEANKTVSRAESIRRFRVLPVDLTEQNGYLTPTLKVKRALIYEDFAAEIEELYR